MFTAANTIQEFLTAAAAKQPAPGGGSVAALAGALAASMGEMVISYSLGKKNLAAFQPELQAGLAELTRCREVLLQLMEEDQAAFETISALRKLPADAPERVEKYDIALLACIRVPQAMAGTGAAMLDLADQLVDKVNVYLLSDLAVCADLAMATVRCGLYNVRINLADLTDVKDRESILRTSAALLSRATALIERVAPRVWERIEQK